MTERLTRQLLADKATVRTTLVLAQPHTVDRTFELPTRLYVAMAGSFFAFLAMMTVTLGNPNLALPMAVNLIFLAMFFAVPAIWTRMRPDDARRATSWERFRRQGVMTAFGHVSAQDAMLQMLVLPAVVFLWGVAIVVIVALVR